MNQRINSMTIETIITCRMGCAACCIAPSISSPIPEMPNGKAAGERCLQLDSAGLCRIFGQAQRPSVCSSLKATASMCGTNASEAMAYLTELERLTA
jgi:uncharacterized protein